MYTAGDHNEIVEKVTQTNTNNENEIYNKNNIMYLKKKKTDNAGWWYKEKEMAKHEHKKVLKRYHASSQQLSELHLIYSFLTWISWRISKLTYKECKERKLKYIFE